MADFINKLEAGSPYTMRVDQLDSAVRFSFLIIQKAKEVIILIERKDWENANKGILQILRSLNRNNMNFEHIRQLIYGRKLEKLLTIELKRLSIEARHLLGDYNRIKKSKTSTQKSHFYRDAESLLRDVIKQEDLLERVLKSFKRQVQRSQGIFFVGINAGGSSTRCSICDKDGNKFKQSGIAGPGMFDFGIYKAVGNMLSAFREAAENNGLNPKTMYVQRVAIGLALDSNSIHLKYAHILSSYIQKFSPNIKDVVTLPDTLVGWYAGLGGSPGISISGGTGHYVYGYNNGVESNHLKYHNKVGLRNMSVCGGRHISFHGTIVLRRLIRQKKSSRFRTIVEEEFKSKKLWPQYQGLGSALNDINKYYPTRRAYYGKLTFDETAQLAFYIILAAKGGDLDARNLVKETAKNQGYLISQVAKDIGLHNKPFKVVYSGNLISANIILHNLKKHLPEFEPYAEVIDHPIIGDEMDALLHIARKNLHFY